MAIQGTCGVAIALSLDIEHTAGASGVSSILWSIHRYHKMSVLCEQAPDAMRSTASALQLLTVSLGKCVHAHLFNGTQACSTRLLFI